MPGMILVFGSVGIIFLCAIIMMLGKLSSQQDEIIKLMKK
jgi:hypothetical protein